MELRLLGCGPTTGRNMRPARITHDLTIVPSWTQDQRRLLGEKIIKLDPESMAFGTGTRSNQDEPLCLGASRFVGRQC